MATHSSVLAWRTRQEPRGYSPYGGKESDVTEVTGHAYTSTIESTHLTQT